MRAAALTTPDLFDWAAMHARTSDPETSHEAAIEVASKLNTLEQMFFDSLSTLGQGTATEIATHAAGRNGDHARVESIRKRAHDLVVRKSVMVTGKRPCQVTGKKANVYELEKAWVSN